MHDVVREICSTRAKKFYDNFHNLQRKERKIFETWFKVYIDRFIQKKKINTHNSRIQKNETRLSFLERRGNGRLSRETIFSF